VTKQAIVRAEHTQYDCRLCVSFPYAVACCFSVTSRNLGTWYCNRTDHIE